MQRTTKHKALIPFLLAVCGSVAADVPSLIPGELRNWVSEAVATRDGEPQWELFSEAASRHLQEKITGHQTRRGTATTPEQDQVSEEALRRDCIWMGTAGEGVAPPGRFRASESLDALLSNSEEVLIGKVIDEEPGFLDAFPGTLYQIRVQRTFGDGGNSRPSGEELLLFYPEGIVRLGSEHFCSTTWRDFARPSRGLRVIVFIYPDEPIVQGILRPKEKHVLFELPSGGVAYPKRLRQNLQQNSLHGSLGHDERLDDLLAVLESRVEQEGSK